MLSVVVLGVMIILVGSIYRPFNCCVHGSYRSLNILEFFVPFLKAWNVQRKILQVLEKSWNLYLEC